MYMYSGYNVDNCRSAGTVVGRFGQRYKDGNDVRLMNAMDMQGTKRRMARTGDGMDGCLTSLYGRLLSVSWEEEREGVGDFGLLSLKRARVCSAGNDNK
jgi:hypothetical protein